MTFRKKTCGRCLVSGVRFGRRADLELHEEPCEENAAYIPTWLEVLKKDNSAIFAAAAHAQRASENAFLPSAVWLEVSLRCSGRLGVGPEWRQVQAGPLG